MTLPKLSQKRLHQFDMHVNFSIQNFIKTAIILLNAILFIGFNSLIKSIIFTLIRQQYLFTYNIFKSNSLFTISFA